MYDYSKLKGRIVEMCGTQTEFASRMGWSTRTTSLKMNQIICFTQKDINKAMEVLEIKPSEVQAYFFNLKVQY